MTRKTLLITLFAALTFFGKVLAGGLPKDATWPQTKEWIDKNKEDITPELAIDWLGQHKETIDWEEFTAWIEEVKDQEGYEWVSAAYEMYEKSIGGKPSKNECIEIKPEFFETTTISDEPGSNSKVKTEDSLYRTWLAEAFNSAKSCIYTEE